MKNSILIFAMITLSNLGFSQVIKQKKENDTVSFSNIKKISHNPYNLSSIKKVLFDWCFRHQIL